MSVNSNIALGNQGDSFSQNCSSIQIPPKLTGEALKEKNEDLYRTLYFCKDFQKAIELIKEGAEIASLADQDPPLLIHTIRHGFKYREDVQYREAGQYEFVKFLIENGVNVDSQSHHYDSALHQAIYSHDNAIAKLLIESKANLNTLNKDGETPLTLAMRHKNNEISKLLIDNNATDLTIQEGFYGNTPLCKAICRREHELAKLLISRMTDEALNIPNKHGHTPFCLAVQSYIVFNSKDIEIVTLLIERKVDLNIKDKNGETPLTVAITYKNNEIAKFLIDNNADLNAQNNSGEFPLSLAISKGNNEIVRYLIEKPATDLTIQQQGYNGNNPLCQAIWDRDDELAKLLISRMTDEALNIPNKRGQTPFHLAVEREDIEIAKLLTERKVDLNTEDICGESPLSSAILSKNGFALLLIENGLDINTKNKYGDTLLMQAINASNNELAMQLIESGADVHIKGQGAETVLDRAYQQVGRLDRAYQQVARGYPNRLIMLLIKKGVKHSDFDRFGYLPHAISRGNNELAKLLIENKLDLNVSYHDGTALTRAIYNHNYELAELIIENAPESLETQYYRRTPLRLAIKQGELEIAHLLISKGANLDPSAHGYRPLYKAVRYGYNGIVEALIEKKALFSGDQSEPSMELNELLIKLTKFEDPETRHRIIKNMYSHFSLVAPALKIIGKTIEDEVKTLSMAAERKLSSQLGRLKKALSRYQKSVQEEGETESLKDLIAEKEREIQEAREVAAKPIGREQLKLRATIPLFIVGMMSTNASEEDLNFVVDTLTNKTSLKNVYTHRTIVKAIYSLYRTNHLSNAEKIAILRKVIADPDKDLKGLLMVAMLAKFKESASLKEFIRTKEDVIPFLKSAIDKLFKSKFDLSGVEDIDDKYAATFKRFRDPEAIFMYAATLEKHRNPDVAKRAKELLSMYVRDVLEGRFETERYNLDNSKHLRKVFRGKVGKALLKNWREGEVINAEALVTNQRASESSKIDYLKVFKEKVSDNHLGHNWEKEYPYLSSAFSAENGVSGALEGINGQLLTAKAEEVPSLRVQQKLLVLCQNRELSSDDQVNLLKQVFKSLAGKELQNDIKALLAGFESEKAKAGKAVSYTVCDTADPCDIILMGQEILGSCQRLDGSAELNIGLLGPLLDGKYRLIVIKDETGKLVARCLLKILWDEKKGVPVLFQEQFYINAANKDAHTQLLNEMCIRKAKKMNLALVKSQDYLTPSYLNPMLSLGGRSDFEYVDALHNVKRNRYEIPSGTVIWQPEA